MSSRYIVMREMPDLSIPQCQLPGSPFASRKSAKAAAARAGIVHFRIVSVTRRAA